MNKGLKTSLSIVLGLVQAGIVPSVLAQQNGIPCPLTSQANRTIVTFDTTAPLVAHDSLAAATAGPIAVTLPVDTYTITVSSFDSHSTKQPPQNQTKEQFYLRLSNGQTTNRISDLPENADSLTEQIDANFNITSAVTSLTAQHEEYPAPGQPNSIFPVCVAFDNVTPSPSPTPTPTPQTSQDNGPGDEADCCPGLDPEPEQSPALSPSRTPTIAGAISNFPTAGFPLASTAAFIVLLLAAILIVPASDHWRRN